MQTLPESRLHPFGAHLPTPGLPAWAPILGQEGVNPWSALAGFTPGLDGLGYRPGTASSCELPLDTPVKVNEVVSASQPPAAMSSTWRATNFSTASGQAGSLEPSESSAAGGDRFLQKQTLGMYLSELQGEDPRCVFIARKVNAMGFRSQELLAAHYARYGEVSRVLVAHSKVKPFRSSGSKPRIRPGSLGFIVMKGSSSVEAILAAGNKQTVAGCEITLEPFERTNTKHRDTRASLVKTHIAISTTDSTSTGGATGSHSGSHGSENGSGSGSREKNEGGSTDSHLGESSDAGSGTDGVPSPGNQPFGDLAEDLETTQPGAKEE